MMFVWILCALSVRIASAQATSHWMVTETGLIQPRDGSPFLMANPFDLLSFLNQDTRWENIFNIYHNLIRRQKTINKLWLKLETDTQFDKYIAENDYCTEVNHIDWYISFVEDGSFNGLTEKEFDLQRSEYGDTDVPDCKKISSLIFSMFAFEHLDSMINRENLNTTPETTLPELFSPLMTVDQFGHWLSAVLHKNSSSWLHYNLAAIYWRVKGNGPKAIECSRRAIHYAPRHHKNIALLCLGSILHRCQHSEDAMVVLEAAVDHNPKFPIAHFALGGALAMLGEFNSSLKHLGLSMKLLPVFDVAQKYTNGILCHIDMLKKIQIAQRSLMELIKVIRKYTDLENLWLRFQTAFLKTMKHEKEYDYRNYEANCVKMGKITGLQIKALKNDGDRNIRVQYLLDTPTYIEHWPKENGITALDTAQGLQKLVKHVAKQVGLPTKKYLPTDYTRNSTKVLKEIGPMPTFPEMFPDPKRINIPRIKAEMRLEYLPDDKPGIMEMGTPKPEPGKLLYPPNFKVNRNKELFDTDPDWPSNKFCKDNAARFPENVELIYPVFLPFDNKGIKLEYLLTEQIGVPALVEHELPWHPPVCPSDKDLTLYTQRKGLKIQMVPDSVGKEVLRLHLLKYLSINHLQILKTMQEVEIGQRIHTAIQKKLAAKWVLYTVASLYWRVRGNIPSALNCLLTASRTADARYRDVVLVSLASVFMEMGLLDECSNHAEEAYKMSPYEPSTNFILAQLSMIKKNHKAHMFHLKQTIRVDGRFLNGIARNLLNSWGCILKQVNTLKELGDLDASEICAEVEPGVSMVCDGDGTNCHISNRDCNNAQKRETSQIVRMLELKADTMQGRSYVRAAINKSLFNKFIEDFPVDRTDKVAHAKHYEELIKTVDKILEDCASRSCGHIEPEDLDIKEDDCSFQQLQLDYWLHIISFRQELTDTDMKLPADIAELTPTKKAVPECKLPTGWVEDFFMDRIMKVDTSGWEPILRLMHQFAEMFSFYDFAELGGRIARYVETKPQSWIGLVAAGWWCGASGRGACAARCLAAAHGRAPRQHRALALRPLAALLHMQSKQNDAKNIAYLSFYAAPRSKVEAFLVAVAHTYRSEFEHAAWMYRYALTFDDKYLPAKACLHISMCLMIFGDATKKMKETAA